MLRKEGEGRVDRVNIKLSDIFVFIEVFNTYGIHIHFSLIKAMLSLYIYFFYLCIH